MIKTNKVFTNQQITNKYSVLRTILALVIGFSIAFVLIFFASDKPLADIATLLIGPLTSASRMVNVVNQWIPLAFTGVAVCLIFSVGQVNLAVEGAFFAGAYVSTLVALIPGIPPVIHFIICGLAGGIAGAIVVGIPAFMNVKLNVLTIVSSLMINYVALYIGQYLILNVVRDPTAGYEASFPFEESAKLNELIPGTKIHSGLILAILVVIFGYILLYKTTYGLKIRTIGQNSRFAKFSGMPVATTLVGIQLIGGFIAGLGGTTEVLGMYNRFSYTGLTNHGWDGVMLAVLARNNPKHIPIAALFLAYLRTSADVLNLTSSVPTELIDIVQAVIITFIAAEKFLSGMEHKAIVKNAQKELETIESS